MSDIAIRVENLGKEYQIGNAPAGYRTFRESVNDAVAAPFRRMARLARGHASAASELNETFWALRDVSFEVKQGEVLGVIGRNGAGKSTLLKILSRITEPTEGRIELHGRVGSLLEVGTGFHPELTGRENIFLNGAILGMRREEIQRKFDEIVDFAGVERFLDTPVKRYSSGMYVRLAFSVAAHLEPDILVIDEVLAVGDASFQSKSIGKMEDVARQGRTVLFVSHNMLAVQNLCTEAILLERGLVKSHGATTGVLRCYLQGLDKSNSIVNWERDKAPGDDDLKLLQVRVSSIGRMQAPFETNSPLFVDMKVELSRDLPGLCIGFDLVAENGTTVWRSYQTDGPISDHPVVGIGLNTLQCTIPAGLLNNGIYRLAPRIGVHNNYWIVQAEEIVHFEVIATHGISPYWNIVNSNNRPGVVAPILSWSLVQ